MINKIIIKEVKGIERKEFNFNIVPNKPNLFVAPNGFGKSSLATAFRSMKRTGIALDGNDLFKHEVDTNPEVSIHMNTGEVFTANKAKNEILDEFSIDVINSQLYSKASSRNFGSFSTTTSDICVKPITVFKTIPETTKFDYSFSIMKKKFGNMGKVLTNLGDLLQKPLFVCRMATLGDDLKKLTQVRKITIIDKYIHELGMLPGTKKQLESSSYDFSKLASINEFSILLNLLLNFKQVDTPNVQDYLDTMQLVKVIEDNKSNLSKTFKYFNFLKIKQELDIMLLNMNTSWQVIKSKKASNSLILELPASSMISNGERDILCFIARLYELKAKLTKQKSIVIIDEIFDYLDDGNLIAAQYYINQMIQHSKEEGKMVYPIILTHLDPQYFKTYVFDLKNVNYLESSIDTVNRFNFNNALKNRNKINSLATHFLHYHPEIVTEPLLGNYNVDEKIFNSRDFYCVVDEELDCYISDKRYDVAIVCTALRLNIEKKVYLQLQDDSRGAFIQEHGTNSKLQYAAEMGVEIPQIYFMLGIIYNEAVHLDPQGKKLISVGHKLKNKVIKKMISDVYYNHIVPTR